METTAEGVETLDQLELIRSLGCSHIQGYIYSKAIRSRRARDAAGGRRLGDHASGPAKQRSDRFTMYRKAAAI